MPAETTMRAPPIDDHWSPTLPAEDRDNHGRQMNIDVLDGAGRRLSGIRFLPREQGIVAGDCMLAQKLALELFEDDALGIANAFA
jgi:hypothetical protein